MTNSINEALEELQPFDKQIIEVLVEHLSTMPSTITYGDLAKRLERRFNLESVDPWRTFGGPLGRIQGICAALGLPSLSVMVVLKNGMKPGTGYAACYREMHPECSAMTDEQIAQQQWEAVRSCTEWQKLLDCCEIDMVFAGPKDYVAEMRARETYEESRKMVQALRSEMERNPEARKRCLELKGETCSVCEFNSEESYGVKGIIHVHHIRPLFELAAGESANTDPDKDLYPVCPNCHALIHSKGPRECYTIAEARAIVEKARRSGALSS